MEMKLKDIARITLGAPITRYSKNYEGTTKKMNVLYSKMDEFYIMEEDVSTEINPKYLAQEGDIIFKIYEPQMAIVIGENSGIPENVVITSKFVILKPNHVEPTFLAELLNSNIAKKQIQKLSEGSAMRIKQIKTSDLNELKFEIPSIEEQKKYTKTLKLINKRIKLHKQLLNKENNFKKGIIEKTQIKGEL